MTVDIRLSLSDDEARRLITLLAAQRDAKQNYVTRMEANDITNLTSSALNDVALLDKVHMEIMREWLDYKSGSVRVTVGAAPTYVQYTMTREDATKIGDLMTTLFDTHAAIIDGMEQEDARHYVNGKLTQMWNELSGLHYAAYHSPKPDLKEVTS